MSIISTDNIKAHIYDTISVNDEVTFVYLVLWRS